MHELDSRQDTARGAGGEARAVPPAAEVVLPATAGNVQSARASEREGGSGAAGVVVTFPCRTVSGMNVREHWAVKAARAKKHRGETYLQLRCAALGYELPCTVTLIRIAPRPLDGDNLQASLKNVRDGVADWLKVDDRDLRVTWKYEQRRGKPKEYAVEVCVCVAQQGAIA